MRKLDRTIMAMLLGLLATPAMAQTTVLSAARIHTMDAARPVAHALAYDASGKILAVGETDELLARYPQARRLDVGKATVVPGLIDAHAHVGGLGFAMMGADLVGKVEANIPEDDPRNPAVIADLVGDNVGDCAGRGADLFESTAAENIGAMILGAGLFPVFGVGGILFPLVARAFGLIASTVGIFVVRGREEDDPMKALNRGYYVTTLLALAGFFVALRVFRWQ